MMDLVTSLGRPYDPIGDRKPAPCNPCLHGYNIRRYINTAFYLFIIIMSAINKQKQKSLARLSSDNKCFIGCLEVNSVIRNAL